MSLGHPQKMIGNSLDIHWKPIGKSLWNSTENHRGSHRIIIANWLRNYRKFIGRLLNSIGQFRNSLQHHWSLIQWPLENCWAIVEHRKHRDISNKSLNTLWIIVRKIMDFHGTIVGNAWCNYFQIVAKQTIRDIIWQLPGKSSDGHWELVDQQNNRKWKICEHAIK